MTDSHKLNYKILENKTRFAGTRGHEIDYDEAECEIDFSNMDKDTQEYISRISKEAISNPI
jgi:hypothetical protein